MYIVAGILIFLLMIVLGMIILCLLSTGSPSLPDTPQKIPMPKTKRPLVADKKNKPNPPPGRTEKTFGVTRISSDDGGAK